MKPTDLDAGQAITVRGIRSLSDALQGANFLVWGGDDTHSLIFGTCKCEDCHGDTLDMEVGSRAASWGIQRRVTGTSEQQGEWALNGILRAYEERKHQDERAQRLARLQADAR